MTIRHIILIIHTWLWLTLMIPLLIAVMLLGISSGGLMELAIYTLPRREAESGEGDDV